MKDIFINKVEILTKSFKNAPYPTFLSLLVLLVMAMGYYLIDINNEASEEKEREIVYLKAEIVKERQKSEFLSLKNDTLKMGISKRLDDEITELKELKKQTLTLKKRIK